MYCASVVGPTSVPTLKTSASFLSLLKSAWSLGIFGCSPYAPAASPAGLMGRRLDCGIPMFADVRAFA
ncbi:MAG: hypothetical protein QM820_06705 [Minicystis sp.]